MKILTDFKDGVSYLNNYLDRIYENKGWGKATRKIHKLFFVLVFFQYFISFVVFPDMTALAQLSQPVKLAIAFETVFFMILNIYYLCFFYKNRKIKGE